MQHITDNTVHTEQTHNWILTMFKLPVTRNFKVLLETCTWRFMKNYLFIENRYVYYKSNTVLMVS